MMVKIIDYEGVHVRCACVVRRGPSFTQMRVLGWQIRMHVRKLVGVGSGPDLERGDHADQADAGEGYEGWRHAVGGSEGARDSVGQQPAGVRQSELSGEKRAAVLRRRRTPQEPP